MAKFEDDVVCTESLFCNSLAVGTASITDAMIAAAGGGTFISPTKLKPRVPLGAANAAGTLSTSTARVFSAYASGTIQQIYCSLDTVPTSTNTVTIDVKKSTAGGAYATILSSTVVFNNASTARTVVAATISSASFVVGDIFQVTWTVVGSSAADLLVTLHGDVNPA